MRKVYVIGGANLDIQGYSDTDLELHDSNIGTIRYSFGGVGRNIAENLALLKDKVALVSVLGTDPFGMDMYRYCQGVGIDMRDCLCVNSTTSTYLAVLDGNRDMYLGINDMKILKNLTPEILTKVLSKVTNDDLVMVDTNLQPELIKCIFEHTRAPIYCDPISGVKAEKIRPFLNRLELFKPNKLEAQQLLGYALDSPKTYLQALRDFRELGVKKIVISLGTDGVLASEGNEYFQLKHPSVKMVNATGAGDSFVAGLIHQEMIGRNLEEAVRFAIGCAMITVRSAFTVSENMSVEKVEEILNQTEMEKEKLC